MGVSVSREDGRGVRYADDWTIRATGGCAVLPLLGISAQPPVSPRASSHVTLAPSSGHGSAFARRPLWVF